MSVAEWWVTAGALGVASGTTFLVSHVRAKAHMAGRIARGRVRVAT